jgi:hypothetical protein
MDKNKTKNIRDYESHTFDNMAIVKDMKLKDTKQKKQKKSDIFVTKDSRVLESALKTNGAKNGKKPYEKKTPKIIEMW